jgi:hypothetical protein
MRADSSETQGAEHAHASDDGDPRVPDFDEAELGRSRFASWLSRAHRPSGRDIEESLPRGVEVTWSSSNSFRALGPEAADAAPEDSVTIVVPPIAYGGRYFLLVTTVVMVGLLAASLRILAHDERGGGPMVLLIMGCLALLALAGTLWAFLQRTIIQASPSELVVRHTVALGRAPRRSAANRVQRVRWESKRFKHRTPTGVGLDEDHYRVWATIGGRDVMLVNTEHAFLASFVSRALRRCLGHAPPGGDGSPKKVRFGRDLVEIHSRTPDGIADELIEAGHRSFAAERFGLRFAEIWATHPGADSKAGAQDAGP